MNRWLSVALLVLLVFSGCLGGQESINESYTSEYSYSVSVQPTANLTNATFYLPAPTRNNESRVAEKLVREQTTVNASGTSNQSTVDAPAWNLSVVRTRFGPMLRVHADTLPAEYVRGQPVDEEGNPIPTNDSTPRRRVYSVSTSLEVDSSIDTNEALRNEPVLQPKFNLSRDECRPPRPDDSAVECYSYRGRLYASYNASPGTEVDVGVSMYGDNSWFQLGWTGNTYHDFTHTVVQGDGWVETEGKFTQGEGNYLDDPPR